VFIDALNMLSARVTAFTAGFHEHKGIANARQNSEMEFRSHSQTRVARSLWSELTGAAEST